MKLLMRGECDCYELAEKTGLHLHTIQGYTYALHRAGVLYVCGWNQDPRGAMTRRIYKLGANFKDVAPPRYTAAQRNVRYREAKKLRDQQAALTFSPPSI